MAHFAMVDFLTGHGITLCTPPGSEREEVSDPGE